MMDGVRTVGRLGVATVAGVAAALFWAVSLAIYQPRMEPTGFFTDPTTGEPYPNLASNNTYWPRDIRQLAILLAVAAVILIGRARRPAVIAGLVLGGVWFAADLWLDRVDVAGNATAGWLAAGGVLGFAAAAAIGVRLAAGPSSALAARLVATAAAVLAAVTLIVQTPWDEPVTDAAQVRTENALTLLEVILVLAWAAVAVGLVSLATARVGRAALTIAVAVGAAVALIAFAPLDFYRFFAVAIVGALGIAAADLPWGRLFGVLAVLAIAAFPGLFAFYFGGMIVGQAMTSIAANPAVNAADTDLSYAFGGLLLAAIFAALVELNRHLRPAEPRTTKLFSEA
jgi:hypothetical protein